MVKESYDTKNKIDLIMTEDQLKTKLSEIGTLVVFKNDFVFTLLLRVNNANSMTVLSVMGLVTKTITDKPIIEVMKNDDDFILLVLKPKAG